MSLETDTQYYGGHSVINYGVGSNLNANTIQGSKVHVVFGGQYGSEGKGKVVKWMCDEFKKGIHWYNKRDGIVVVRVGGPNSGHIVYDNRGEKQVLCQLPVSVVDDQPGNGIQMHAIASGSYIDTDMFMKEFEEHNVDVNKLWVHPLAVIIDDECREKEKEIIKSIGSTGKGIGNALIKRIKRDGSVRYAKDDPVVARFTERKGTEYHDYMSHNVDYLIEGTQGYGLSLLNNEVKCTSRDTSVASFLSEAQLPPSMLLHRVMVIRTFPIRVAGNSGDLPEEMTWEEVSKYGGNEGIEEKTTVTKKVRRVGAIDKKVLQESCLVNDPNITVCNHLDYIDKECYEVSYADEITPKAMEWLNNVNENVLPRKRGRGRYKIDYVGTSPTEIVPVTEYAKTIDF